MNIYYLLMFLFSLLISINFANSQHNSNNSNKIKRPLKILVYSPSLSWSHAQFLGRIADTLVEAGHEVHFLKYIMEPDLKEKNETKRVNQAFKYIIEPNPESIVILDVKKQNLTHSFNQKRPFLPLFNHPIYQFAPMFIPACKETINKRNLLQKLTNEHFDVGIGEMYDYCAAALFHKIGVRTPLTVFATNLLQWQARKFDIPTFASFVPNAFAPMLGLESSFITRLVNFYNEFYNWIWMDDHILRLQDPVIRKEFGADFPDLKELVKKSSLVFSNTYPILDMPRPITNKIVYIGGIVDDLDNSDSKKLEPKFKNLLDEATEGAVLFSFGSITDTSKLNNYMIETILRAFKHFSKIQFIWKLDKETIKNISNLLQSIPNVHTFEWIRQPAILAHPNLKIFITHCGQNSLTESLRSGIPIIGVPLFADQFHNSDLAQHLGAGLQIEVNNLNGPNAEQLLIEAIESILKNPSFHQKAQIISKKMRLTPFSPKERLVKWVEYAAEFDDLKEFDLPGDKEMNWFFYYSIDVILFTNIVTIISTWLIIKFTNWLLIRLIELLMWLLSTIKNLQIKKIESELRKNK